MATKNKLRLSASQIDSAQSCLRRWWLSKVARAPQPFNRNLLLGEVLHGVAENFLLDKELYPENWTAPVNRFTGQISKHHITVTEQALVKALISKSIEQGILLREPDGEVEKQFGKDMGVVDSIDGIDISLIGFIDYTYGNHVDDHKATKAPRYYGKAKLSKATAMNLYAYAGYEEGFITDPTVWLRYNLFVKDTSRPMVKAVIVEKTKEEIYDFYEQHIRPHYKSMALAYKNCTSWEQVDDAMTKGCGDVCKKYGGCEYLDICLGKVTLEEYKSRFETENIEDVKQSQVSVLERLQSGVEIEQPKTKTKEKKPMSFLQDMKKKEQQQNTTQPDPAAAQPAKQPEAPATQPDPASSAQPEATEHIKAPWAYDGCPVCSTSNPPIWGVKGAEPCKICVISSNGEKESGIDRPVLDDFEVAVGDDGTVSWTAKEPTASEPAPEPVVETNPVEQPPVVKEDVQTKSGSEFAEDPVETKAPETADTSTQVVQEQPASDPVSLASDQPHGIVFSKDDYNPERTGRFTLSYAPVNSRTARVSRKVGEQNCVVHISELVEMVGLVLLEKENEQGAAASSFMDLDVFRRRDLIAKNAKAIAEMIGNSTVDASNLVVASMEHCVAQAIERYASVVIGWMGH